MSESNTLVCFTNCLLALEDGSLVSRDLWIDSDLGLILDAQHTFFARQTRPSRVVDLNGAVLAPGLLDIQINGAFGVDFSIYNDNKGVPASSEAEIAADNSYVESLIRVANGIVETGVTGRVFPHFLSDRHGSSHNAYTVSHDRLVPTIVTQYRDIYPKLLSLLAPRGSPHGAHLLGWHAEGVSPSCFSHARLKCLMGHIRAL
ncbi:hypothetical protein FRC08_015510 [Ceratobasidium sp. 394]|nr:hypothetical protein FRC08_015510 [Ceratobasidium sp. 394]